MNQHLLSLRYAFQNPISTTDAKTHSFLLSVEGSNHQPLPDTSHIWCISGVGQRSSSFWKACQDGWDLAQVDQVQRHLISADQHTRQTQWASTDPQWKDSLLAQLNSFKVILSEDTIESSKESSKHIHLLLLLGSKLPPKLSPPSLKNCNLFASITVIFESPPLHFLAWSRWSVLAGASLLFNQSNLSTQLANTLQVQTYTHPRLPLVLEPSESVQIQSITQLTPCLHSMAVDSNQPELNMIIPATAENQRTSWFIHLKGDFSKDIPARTVLTCRLQNQTYEIQSSGVFDSQNESLNPSVAFANQLSHRSHCVEGILYAYQHNKLRRVLQYLDQWIKLSLAFENEESTQYLYSMKVRFLSLGTFQKDDLHHLICYGFAPIYHLSSIGQWHYSPYRFNG
jgi:hypothetical protein